MNFPFTRFFWNKVQVIAYVIVYNEKQALFPSYTTLISK